MKRSAFPIQVLGVAGVVATLLLLLAHPAGALPSLLQPEPETRVPPAPVPFVQLDPSLGPAGIRTRVVASGALWAPGGNLVLYWDSTDNRVSNVTVNADGTFQTTFETPADAPLGSAGSHIVIAVQDGLRAEATFVLEPPTPTWTPSPTVPPPPSDTPAPVPPTATRAPTLTFTPAPTLTPSPTLRPVTPMVTISPIPHTPVPPAPARTNTPVIVRTNTPAAARTNTPLPGTLTFTPTPSVTPSPTQTPGPGTPSVTPPSIAAATATATPVQEMADTGSGSGMFLLLGLVMAGLLVGVRLLRVRGVAG